MLSSRSLLIITDSLAQKSIRFRNFPQWQVNSGELCWRVRGDSTEINRDATTLTLVCSVFPWKVCLLRVLRGKAEDAPGAAPAPLSFGVTEVEEGGAWAWNQVKQRITIACSSERQKIYRVIKRERERSSSQSINMTAFRITMTVTLWHCQSLYDNSKNNPPPLSSIKKQVQESVGATSEK